MQYQTITDNNYQMEATIASFESERGVSEYHLIIQKTEGSQSFAEQAERLFSFFEHLRANVLHGATVVFQRFFLSDAANQASLLSAFLPDNKSNTSIIEQPPLNGAKIALWAYLQTNVEVVDAAQDSSGLFAVRHGSYLHLWKGSAVCQANDSEWQMNRLLKEYMEQLSRYDCTLSNHCIRTWIFVQNVDVNYGGIVKARRETFAENGLTENTHYIASTGISGRHADPNSIVIFDAYAVQGLQPEQIQYLYAKTHLSPTHKYGVTFERGTCIRYGDRRHTFISGTASIDRNGLIVHEGDVVKQTYRTIENVETLLQEAGHELHDIAHIIVYMRDIADYNTIRPIFDRQFAEIPKVYVLASVCRPGWLVEMECIAIRQDENNSFDPF